jgi:hypothetical protein
MWIYADYRTPYIFFLAQSMEPDIIKIDPGEPGSIETTSVMHRIAAITFELPLPLSLPKRGNQTYAHCATLALSDL